MSTSKNIYKKYSATNKTLLSANIYMIRPRVCIQKKVKTLQCFPHRRLKAKGTNNKTKQKKSHVSLKELILCIMLILTNAYILN